MNLNKEMSTNELVALFKQKSEIDFRINYYKGILQSIDEAIVAIDNRLENGVTTERYFILFLLPVSRKIVLDKYDKAKLKREKHELESELFMKKEYFERWLKRNQQYETEFDKRYKECEISYDWIFGEAQRVAETNMRLASIMAKYDNKDNDKKVRLEYYLYIKQEVENWYAFNKKKFVLMASSPNISSIAPAPVENN